MCDPASHWSGSASHWWVSWPEHVKEQAWMEDGMRRLATTTPPPAQLQQQHAASFDGAEPPPKRAAVTRCTDHREASAGLLVEAICSCALDMLPPSENRDAMLAGVQRLCALNAEGVLAKETFLLEIKRACDRAVLKRAIQLVASQSGDTQLQHGIALTDELARCGRAMPDLLSAASDTASDTTAVDFSSSDLSQSLDSKQ